MKFKCSQVLHNPDTFQELSNLFSPRETCLQHFADFLEMRSRHLAEFFNFPIKDSPIFPEFHKTPLIAEIHRISLLFPGIPYLGKYNKEIRKFRLAFSENNYLPEIHQIVQQFIILADEPEVTVIAQRRTRTTRVDSQTHLTEFRLRGGAGRQR